MAIRVAINHKTEYRFDRPVKLSPHLVRLRPAPHTRTPIIAYSLKVNPEPYFLNWQQDPFNNYVARYVFPEKVHYLTIQVDLIAEMTVINPFDFFLEEEAEQIPLEYEPQLKRDLAPYLEIRENGERLLEWLEGVDRTPRATVDFLVDINQRLQQDIGYIVRMKPGVQTCEETLSLRTGSCRDSAWLLVQILRHLGLAARFVSGYLVQLAADVKSLEGPSGPEQDFTDLHAWAEVFIPGAGWLGLDATSGLFAGEGHIPLSCTPSPGSAAPVTGAMDECEVEFSHSNTVSRVHEDPRVTRPYSDSQWQAIMALGDKVDEDLQAGDVRLTMGGEPTFVSIDNMEGEEWNTAAFGEEKRKKSEQLLTRLREKFAPGSMRHYGQGKWYPGEPLPRWAMSCYWRVDGKPVWRDDALLAKPEQQYEPVATEQAEQFVNVLSERLGISTTRVIPGYEDIYYSLWSEGSLPVNVDPFDSQLKDPLERKRLREQFEEGLDKVVGYTLPLRWNESEKSWQSSAWPLRRERLYLVPGNSPMGYRLPLSSLPWVMPEDQEIEPDLDPFAEHGELPDGDALNGKTQVVADKGKDAPEPHEVIHTALCAQVRDGRLYLFLPPVKTIEAFLALINHIEKTAAELALPVTLEGYEPPFDTRLTRFQVTPDPGVIEVNIHPMHSWKELVENTHTLYEEARQCRLGTEKFMLDGRHSGTGGGNHVTFGGATPADSPALRKPSLLQSLVTYWQNHPSLSYLFSGMFVGPTSQAPRVDEARNDSLYELEIAFQQMPEGEVPEPWLIDRLLRNLLVDLTGNTHRAEFCIDKLYSPSGPAGRLGLVEFRAFEMPPHYRMSLAQMLLLRALIARFWKQPYTHKLIRWGTELHDRFMLQHYIWQDFRMVIEDLQNSGYAFELDWYAPFLEFRFPHFGSVTVEGMELDLHWAIEPWHVLGEETSLQGTSRYVDSSVERLQVRVRGMSDPRYIVTCNGRKVPLRKTGSAAEYVAGVRYKAWQPPSGLHPNIPVQAPLVFDVVDTLNKRSLGGCSYHVSHPGGRNYETFPVNANEAEARRIARFFAHGHTPGTVDPVDEPYHPEHPYTLDLRYG